MTWMILDDLGIPPWKTSICWGGRLPRHLATMQWREQPARSRRAPKSARHLTHHFAQNAQRHTKMMEPCSFWHPYAPKFHCTSFWTCRSVKIFQRFRPQEVLNAFEDLLTSVRARYGELVQLAGAASWCPSESGPAPLPWKSRSWSSQTRTKPSLPPVLGHPKSSTLWAERDEWNQ